MKKSRTEFATLNTGIALAMQPFQVILAFVNRTVFVNMLGVTYLGLSSYLASIISILSLAELGIAEAMNYALYGPLVREEHGKINAFMILYKKLYRMIGVSVFILGAIVSLFLPYMIKDYKIDNELYLIYFLFVFNSAFSYFFSYKRTLLFVDQRNYVMTLIDFALNIVRVLMQIGVLVFTKNYVLYLLIEIILRILGNVIISNVVDHLCDYLYNGEITPISEEEKNKFIRNIKGNVLGSIGSKVVYQTDSILMAKFISLAAIGIYGNYTYVVSFVSLVPITLINSVMASVGNLVHSENTTLEGKINFLKKFQFIAFTIIYFMGVGYLLFIHPFITIWLGENFLLNYFIEILIVVNFFLTEYRRPILLMVSVYGLSYEQNKKVIAEILLNISLSLYFLMVLDLGIAGILLGTICSTLLTCIWYEPYSVFKYGVRSSPINYFKIMFKHFSIFLLSIIFIVILELYIFSHQGFIYSLIEKTIIYLVMFSSYMYIFRNHEATIYIKHIIKKFLFLKRLRRK